MKNYFLNKYIYSTDFINSYHISKILRLNIAIFSPKLEKKIISKSI